MCRLFMVFRNSRYKQGVPTVSVLLDVLIVLPEEVSTYLHNYISYQLECRSTTDPCIWVKIEEGNCETSLGNIVQLSFHC